MRFSTLFCEGLGFFYFVGISLQKKIFLRFVTDIFSWVIKVIELSPRSVQSFFSTILFHVFESSALKHFAACWESPLNRKRGKVRKFSKEIHHFSMECTAFCVELSIVLEELIILRNYVVHNKVHPQILYIILRFA